ncbi:uncharacterized protein CLUP02_11798 [Colletotrichum lupini]|uniref:Uncharacterized protein n=1 Tax=Colletotrichum lupini TaxID=145971 RepID=A0A9Q8SZX1_9PEZI|nr:uncharacterized protein CLUP02_11798 [Colletotrichum lupini]UQC86298.1 hypothetical protein CLUP02_11798 [Colletotrichum lupini]
MVAADGSFEIPDIRRWDQSLYKSICVLHLRHLPLSTRSSLRDVDSRWRLRSRPIPLHGGALVTSRPALLFSTLPSSVCGPSSEHPSNQDRAKGHTLPVAVVARRDSVLLSLTYTTSFPAEGAFSTFRVNASPRQCLSLSVPDKVVLERNPGSIRSRDWSRERPSGLPHSVSSLGIPTLAGRLPEFGSLTFWAFSGKSSQGHRMTRPLSTWRVAPLRRRDHVKLVYFPGPHRSVGELWKGAENALAGPEFSSLFVFYASVNAEQLRARWELEDALLQSICLPDETKWTYLGAANQSEMPSLAVGLVVTLNRNEVMTCLIPVGLQLSTCTAETKPFQSRLETFSGQVREDWPLTEALSRVQTPVRKMERNLRTANLHFHLDRHLSIQHHHCLRYILKDNIVGHSICSPSEHYKHRRIWPLNLSTKKIPSPTKSIIPTSEHRLIGKQGQYLVQHLRKISQAIASESSVNDKAKHIGARRVEEIHPIDVAEPSNMAPSAIRVFGQAENMCSWAKGVQMMLDNDYHWFNIMSLIMIMSSADTFRQTSNLKASSSLVILHKGRTFKMGRPFQIYMIARVHAGQQGRHWHQDFSMAKVTSTIPHDAESISRKKPP